MNEQWLVTVANPVLRDHQVYGRHLMPGLAYIDMAYQAFRKHGYDHRRLELHRVVLCRPLDVAVDADVLLTIQAARDTEARWQITIDGQRRHRGGLAEERVRYVTAEMRESGIASFHASVDLDAVRAAAVRCVPMAELYGRCRRRQLVHGPFMQTHGTVYVTDAAVYVDGWLEDSALAAASGFIVHPALVDGCALGAAGAFVQPDVDDRDQPPVIPLFYESFRAAAMLQRRGLARVSNASLRRDGDVSYFSVEFFDEHGAQVAELKNFAGKVVRHAGLIDPARATVTVAAVTAGDQRGDATSPAGPEATLAQAEETVQRALATHLRVPVAQVDRAAGFYDMGIDSVGLLALIDELSSILGQSLSPTLPFEFSSVAQLAAHLASRYPWPRTNTAAAPAAVDDRSQADAADAPTGGPVAAMPLVPADTRGIAIVGMAGRFPTAGSIAEFWENLKAGRDSVTEIPPSRWPWRWFDGVRSPSGKPLSRWGGFIDAVDCFDAEFFHIPPRKAELMDPQERLFLEVAWEAIEDAGYTPQSLAAVDDAGRARRVGVFAGVMHKDYSLLTNDEIRSGQALPVSLSNATIPNRVSYVGDFHGPSIAVDTVCSSSLIAVHLAVQSLRSGECEAAIAGGVNLSLHPRKYLTYGAMDMYAADGRCHAFGSQGTGYVSGEAVAAILLKPLDRALADGDHIYAVIRGTATNHVGRASGFTVPSPVAQADVITRCLEAADVDARTLGYVEAHGTGTELGDPIEIEGLTKAFRQQTRDTHFCAIGSVKSNIGHAESAAGISGLIKAVLQLHHRLLVPSLHSQELNPHIDWSQSPFVVQRDLQPWVQGAHGGQPPAHPRRAAVSSFGATGSNAHVVLEEWSTPPAAPVSASTPAVVPLSASNRDRLREYATKLHDHLVAIERSSDDAGRAIAGRRQATLQEIAYTLQVGRRAMRMRVAFVSASIPALIAQLDGFVHGAPHEGVYDADAEGGGEHTPGVDLHLPAADDVGGLERLARRWVRGADVRWEALHAERAARRISLPTYPFAKQRHWLPHEAEHPISAPPRLHPLLHANTSTLDGQRYSSTFTGHESFLRDHVADGRCVLPAAAYLEMARAAVELARPRAGVQGDGDGGALSLVDVVWLRPLAVATEPATVHVSVSLAAHGDIEFTVRGDAGSENGPGESDADRVYARGRSSLEPPRTAVAPLDLAALRAGCNERVSGAQCYDALERCRLVYGPAHRTVSSVARGTDAEGRQYVLAELALPECADDESSGYWLSPSMLDGALQASIALTLAPAHGDHTPVASMPFALGCLDVVAPIPARAVAYVRRHDAERHGSFPSVDIDICDEQGRVCARIRRLSSRPVTDVVEEVGGGNDVLLLTRDWQPAPGVDRAESRLDPTYEQRWVVLDPVFRFAAPALHARWPGMGVDIWQPESSSSFDGIAERGVHLLTRLQRVLGAVTGRVLFQVAVPFAEGEEGHVLASAAAGLLKSARQENPALVAQVIELSPDQSPDGLAAILDVSAATPDEHEIRHLSGQRQIVRVAEIVASGRASHALWRDAGVYLITGGAGGLGTIVAQDIVERTSNARLVLVGRSPLSDEKRARLTALERGGATVDYRALDVADDRAVSTLIDDLCSAYGALTGVVHAAGVVHDRLLRSKTVADVQAVFAPKITGVLNVDRATARLPLECFVLFSSVSADLGNVGQGDYAFANGFLNGFAEYRERCVRSGRRHGRTLAIAWPLWASGGMHVEPTADAQLRERGFRALSIGEGLAALHAASAAGRSRVAVLSGDRSRLRQRLRLAVGASEDAHPEARPTVSPSATRTAADTDTVLRDNTERHLRHLLGATLKLPVDQIDAMAPLENYGMDSILAVHLVNKLEPAVGPLSKTLFFEYQSLDAAAEYLLSAHRESLVHLFGIEHASEVAPPVSAPPVPVVAPPPARTAVSESVRANEPPAAPGGWDIAIVGLSGRYPRASTVQEFWDNLIAGTDCITEIPSDRWDYRRYFDERPGTPGKTYANWGGFIDGVDAFDPLFFNISPREAAGMDPQERLFLECVYETLEDAGYTRDALRTDRRSGEDANVGVFVGVMYAEYPLLGVQAQALGRPFALSGTVSSIANRVSYFCNFHGPSLAIDTMCSSSLTSIYLACQSLLHGGCDAAIAGGVNVSIHPNKYLALAHGRFLSSTGRCASFGAGGDGYVPGEGVGAVLLKPLARAIADGDHIYGVIKGAAINHGGKTNGYTVPNPVLQGRVIAQALTAAGVEARAVSYIEAHGTGTSLGDPIEIAGLSQAFARETADLSYCAIGSVKSNIGHCESAAGIAGLTKVLLQMKHQTLVKSLHSGTVNPHIDFAQTPFFPQQENAPWRRPVLDVDGHPREYPRIAGVSAFGAGGSNAHLIVSEYIPAVPARLAADLPAAVVVVLSAKNEDRLRAQIERLLRAIDERPLRDADLRSLAFTLQVGREAMDERLACVASSMETVRTKLARHLAGDTAIDDVYRGNAKRHKDAWSLLAGETDLRHAIDSWAGNADKLFKVADLWTNGLAIDWRAIYSGDVPPRISLPAYPFSRERYWAPTSDASSIHRSSVSAGVATLHSLVHRNTSTLVAQRFSSTFTGEESVFTEDAASGERRLCESAYLEIARVAVTESWEATGDAPVVRLDAIEFVRPLLADRAPCDVHVTLRVADADVSSIDCEVHTGRGDDTTLHARGRASLRPRDQAPVHDIEAIAAACEPIPGDAHLAGGPRRSDDSVVLGARMRPGHVVAPWAAAPGADDASDCAVHVRPFTTAMSAGRMCAASALDSTAIVGRLTALECVEIRDRCPSRGWVWACRRSGAETEPAIVDVEICDEHGRVAVSIRGAQFEPAAAVSSPRAADRAATAAVAHAVMAPSWVPVAIAHGGEWPSVEERVAIAGDTAVLGRALRERYRDALILPDADATVEQLRGCLADAGRLSHVFWILPSGAGLDPASDALLHAQRVGLLAGFRLMKALIARGYDSAPLGLTVVTQQTQAVTPADTVCPAHAGVHGFVGAVAKEHPHWSVRLVDVPADAAWPVESLLSIEAQPLGQTLAYRSGRWLRQQLVPCELASAAGSPLRRGGTYVIIGGAGGLGEICTEHLIRTADARVVWIGRRPHDAEIARKLERLGAHGRTPLYWCADATDRAALDVACEEILDRCGRIDGIVLSAVGPVDDRLARMSEAQFLSGLAAKIDVSVRIAQVFARVQPQLLVAFSSAAAFERPGGMSSYVAGCVFQDAFMCALRGRSIGTIRVVNWGYWGNVGIGAAIPESLKTRLRLSGGDPIDPSVAMDAFDRLLTSSVEQIVVATRMEPSASAGRSPHGPAAAARPVAPATVVATTPLAVDDEVLRERAIARVKRIVAQALRMSPSQVDATEPLDAYGVDSILVVQITKALREAFGDISSTFLFEQRTIAALVDTLIATRRDALLRRFGPAEQPAPTPRTHPTPTVATPTPTVLDRPRSGRGRFIAPARSAIAVIGLSGRYPGAANVDQFWERLREGADCIREVPPDRWDWREYYGTEKGRWGTIYSKWGGFVDDIASFDPLFFSISPREAEGMDPQERLFLQEAHACVSDAGYAPSTVCSTQKVGVFVGVTTSTYRRRPIHWSIANRVSSAFGFRGPSLVVDTACSASLTAIHLAFESLQNGSSDCAIAGGVHLIVDPVQYMGLSAATMLTATSQCRAFGVDADGFVPGEGVGAVLLKPLATAVADGDHIYGVLKGSAINHGGKTNGYTVPNPTAQAEVIAEAIRAAGVHPRAISCIEAHGTGTLLGDPIEVAGLTGAFAEHASDRQYCRIGSVKTNIGHAESAAGIAGLTKVLLQMKHRTIVRSLHCEALNPHIDFAASPFVVQQQNAPWERPVLNLTGQAKAYPRVAGISSFGVGGANAHLVVEEYVGGDGESAVPLDAHGPAVVILSAKTDAQLDDQIAQLLAAIRDPNGELREVGLDDLAYTLQLGREPLEYRFACVVSSMTALESVLASHVDRRVDVDEFYRGQIDAHKETLATFAADDDMRATMAAWIAKGKFAKLASAWVRGFAVDWPVLHGQARRRRVRLPTYPFAKERYWKRERDLVAHVGRASAGEPSSARQLHPLLHRQAPGANGHTFSSTFTGDEFFFRDHVVQGRRVLPAAAQLEWARTAFEHATGMSSVEVRLEDVTFLRPIVCGSASLELHITLQSRPDGGLAFEIYGDGGPDASRVVYVEGRAVPAPRAAGVVDLDLSTLRAACTEQEWDGDACYARFGRIGIAHGPAFRALTRVCTGHDSSGRRIALGDLCLPEAAVALHDGYVLHPGIVDAALQSTMALLPATLDNAPDAGSDTVSDNPASAAMPFALDHVRIVAPVSSRACVLVRFASDGDSAERAQRLDIDIADERGHVCVVLNGLVLRRAAASHTLRAASDENETLTLANVWDVATLARETVDASESVVIVGGTEIQQQQLRAQYPSARCLELGRLLDVDAMTRRLADGDAFTRLFWIVGDNGAASGDAILDAQQDGVFFGVRLIRALLARGYDAKPIVFTAVTQQTQSVARGEVVRPAHAAVHGLLGSLAKEYTHWRVSALDLPAEGTWPAADLCSIRPEPRDVTLAYRHGRWHAPRLVRCELPQSTTSRLRRRGTYVILGGAGGLGEVLSEYLIRHYEAQVVWIGRRPHDQAIEKKQQRLAAFGAEPVYIQADAADAEALRAAYQQIRARIGTIHGVVHATVVLKDQGLARMDDASVAATLRAKIDVAVRLAETFCDQTLDFVLFFSGLQSTIKAAGQGNYAAACTVTDAYAHALGSQWPCPVKVVNWGYWGTVGIVASAEYRERMARGGLGSIDPDEAMSVIERLLVAPVDQVAFLAATRREIATALGVVPGEALTIAAPSPSALADLPSRTASTFGVDERAAARGRTFESQLAKMLWGQLHALGLLAGAGVDVEGWQRASRLPAAYDRWLQQSLEWLIAYGYVGRDDAGLRVLPAETPTMKALWQEWESYAAQQDEAQRPRVALVERTLRELPSILAGQCAATEVVFPNSSMALVQAIYTQHRVPDFFNAIVGEMLLAYVEARIRHDPGARLRIVEVGAGTGATSEHLFERLAPYAAHVDEYCYTDISKAFLLHAQDRFASRVRHLRTHRLNIEQPIGPQGLDVGAYDVAVATNVLHATKDMRRTLRNVKALLRQQGLVLINEMIGGSLFTHLTFGLLPGWWRHEDAEVRLPGSPALSPLAWRHVLESEGFSGVGHPAEAFQHLGQQIIVAHSDGVVRQPAGARPASVRAGTGAEARVERDAGTRAEKPSEKPFEKPSKKAPEDASVGRPKAPVETSMPASSERRLAAPDPKALETRVRGAVRDSIVETVRLDPSRVQDDRPFAEYGVDSILGIALIRSLNATLGLSMSTTTLFDYSTVNRLVHHITHDHATKLAGSPPPAEPQPKPAPTADAAPREDRRPPAAPDRSRPPVITADTPAPRTRSGHRDELRTGRSYQRVIVAGPGTVDDVQIVEDVVRPLGGDEVLISVRAFSLNFGDLLCVKGLYPTMPPYPFTPGVELSGVVAAVGAEVKAIAVGQHVVALTGATGAHATAAICAERHVFPLPERLTFEQGASLPAVGLTTIAMFRRIQLERGEKILVQTAAGGVGLMAIQLARHLGGEIYATAGSDVKLQYLRSLGVPHVINYRETDFEAAITSATGGAGVDVVINTLSGDALQKGLQCLAPGGRYVDIAMTSLRSAKSIDLSMLGANQTVFSVDLLKLFAHRPRLLSEYWRELVTLVAEGVINPTLGRGVSFGEVREAYRCLEDRQNIGKVVVSIPAEHQFTIADGERSHASRTVAARDARAASHQEPIAIVGLSGRFASARDVDELWTYLAAGRELIGQATRWPLPDDAVAAAEGICRRGGFLHDIDCFDPVFFNISGVEATYMDPQQRLFLEEAWKALEDAGYVGAGIEGARCGVYVGCTAGDYQRLFDGAAPAQAFWGNAQSVVPARIAYYLDLQGPAMAVDTACSSSLVSAHLACQALRAREIDLALAGGVFVQCTPGFYRAATRAGMLSPTGHCYTFDARADGFVPGEGVGAIVLKRLSDARADGDHIYAVIRGSGINQDGATNGLTAPSARSQERLERRVYEDCGVRPSDIQVVEAHGTGTTLGDPIEYRALTDVFAGRDTNDRCAIGSIKTNIGHAAAAAGIAGLIKVVLSLQHRHIPASLNYERPNPHIDVESSPFQVNTRLAEWRVEPGRPRRAALSSFGMSGTNAHMVIEEAAEDTPPSSPPRPAYLIALSARTNDQLVQQADRLSSFCQRGPVDCGHMSYTLIVGRRRLKWRLACVVQSSDDLVTKLRQWIADGRAADVYAGVADESGDKGPLERISREYVERCRHAGFGAAYRDHLATIAELFIRGFELDLASLFADGRYRRIRLPTYPFAQQRYWPSPAGSGAPAAATRMDAAAADTSMEPWPAAPADVAPVDHLQSVLRQLLAETVGLPDHEIVADKPFHELGIDSVLMMKLVRRVERACGVALTGRELVDHPTVGALAALLALKTTSDEQPAPVDTDDVGHLLRAFKNGDIGLAEIKTIIDQRAFD